MFFNGGFDQKWCGGEKKRKQESFNVATFQKPGGRGEDKAIRGVESARRPSEPIGLTVRLSRLLFCGEYVIGLENCRFQRGPGGSGFYEAGEVNLISF